MSGDWNRDNFAREHLTRNKINTDKQINTANGRGTATDYIERGGKMAKLFDKANPSIVILILLINVYFTSPLLLLSKNQVRLKRSSPGW